MPGVVGAATASLGGYGACFRGASARCTKLLSSGSVAQFVAVRLPQPSVVEESRMNGRLLPDLSGSDCSSIAVAPKPQHASPKLSWKNRKRFAMEQILSSIGCAQADRPLRVLKAFRDFDKTLIVTSRPRIYEYLIHKFCRLGQVSQAVELVEEMGNEKILLHASIFTPILTSLSKRFLLDEASEAIAAMRRMQIRPRIRHYNMLMQACAVTGDMEKAYGILAELQQHGNCPNAESFSHIIKGFCNLGRFKRAKAVLQEMEQAGLKPNSYTYSLLLRTSVANNDFNASTKLINEMKDRGLQTDNLTARVMNSFQVNSGDLDNVLKVVNKTTIGGQRSGLSVQSQLLRRLALAGRLDEAYKVYQQIKGGSKSQIQGSSLILLAAYGTVGELDRMVEIFEESIYQGSCTKSTETYGPNCYVTVSCIHMTLSFLRHSQLGRCAKVLQRISESGMTNTGVLVDKIFLHISRSLGDVNDGLALLKELRALDIQPSRIALETLLDCCISKGNSRAALEIEQEMEKKGLPLNIFSKLRLFGIFVAASNQSGAMRVLDEMSSDDLRDGDVQFLVLRILNVFGKGSRGAEPDGPLHKEVYRRFHVHQQEPFISSSEHLLTR